MKIDPSRSDGEGRLWFERALLETGWAEAVRLTLAGGRIAAAQAGVRPEAEDERCGIAVPGLCNLHSHAFQRGMAGLAETRGPAGDDFWTWREVMYRFLAGLTPEATQAIAALAYAEMLEAGFTRVGEFHYLHHAPDGRAYDDPAELAARIAAAAGQTGIGLTLLPVFYAHSGFGGAPSSAAQRRFVNDLDGFARLLEASRAATAGLEGAVVGLAPHSLRAATPDELAALVPLAQGGPIHIHIAEQTREVEDCVAWSGRRPVEWLLDAAPVDARWCLVHATHMTPEETLRLAASGAVAGLCPITEANLGDGLFPAGAFLAAGGAFGIGSDSNVLIDAAEELRTLEYGQRLTRRGRNLLAAAEGASTGAGLWRGALAGGAQALGAPAGGLRAGGPADIVSLRSDHPALAARAGDAVLDSLVFAGGRGAIDGVWRAGRKRVSDGRHHQGEAIRARYGQVLRELLA
ncbi:MAG: formimidoylglutamate deiminase [Caulobacteraceae bacterium]|nr:formimidoylglutamate deiminase [Caulobacteraceae bacterium]